MTGLFQRRWHFLLCSLLGGSSAGRCAEVHCQSSGKTNLTAEVQGAAMTTYFVGLFSDLTAPDREDLRLALRETDPLQMAQKIAELQSHLGQGLLQDKADLIQWLRAHFLSGQIEVLRMPEDGTFVFLKTTPGLAQRITCAADAGEIPMIFSSLAN